MCRSSTATRRHSPPPSWREEVEKYLDDRGQRILRALDVAATRHEASPAQVALAWLLTRPGVTAPVASATTLQQLDELARATRLELEEASVRQLTEASERE
ncbi:MAG: aldo/keto reductase [Dongiaceae bacterium]